MSEYNSNTGSYIEWSTIIAGAVLASALSLVMLQFGSAVGVADMETYRSSLSDADLSSDKIIQRTIMTTIYILIIQVLSSMLGGYLAGRMRAPISTATEHEKEVRDGFHGVLVWATATLAVAVAIAIAAAFAHLAVNATPAEAEKAELVLQREHDTAILLAFAAAATSLVSGVAAWASAVKGGDHRDRGIDYGRHITFLVRK